MQEIKIKITGVTPLLLHSDRGVNRFDPLVRQMSAISGKRKKSDEDHLDMARIEYELALSVDSSGLPAIPTYQIFASLRDGAKKTKQGTAAKSGLVIVAKTGLVQLEYSGPKTVALLFADRRFVDQRSVVVQRSRIIRTRPIFQEWKLSFSIAFDESVFDKDQVLSFVDTAGQYCGIGDYRPMYGRYVRE